MADELRISLFGIGYVGSVSAACLARDAHTVIAVDTNPHKVEALNQGRAPIVEPALDALIRSGVESGRLRATTCAEEAVAQTNMSIICVGTPSAPDGSLDLSAVERVATVIGEALVEKAAFHAVVVRSTLTVGAMRRRIAPLIEQASGLVCGAGFGLACYPEFLREGTAIRDYDEPSLSVMAATDETTLERLHRLHPKSAPSTVVVDFEEAEAIKSVSNVWHAVKVGFANEVGGLLGAQGLDSHRVLEAVCLDRRLNMSSAYMRSGFAFGGSCLPKDLRAFIALGRATGQSVSMLDGVLTANDDVISQAVSSVEAAGGRRVSIIGLAFKPGTDDLRESPFVALAERLIAQGCDLRIFDPGVRIDRLTGANLAYAMERLPHLGAQICDTLEAAVRHGETLVLAHPGVGAAALNLAGVGQRIIDLVRVRPGLRTGGDYRGLSW